MRTEVQKIEKEKTSTEIKNNNADEELPPFETTTLWDYPKQSYGKSKKGNNKFQGVTLTSIRCRRTICRV